ncbi:MAG: thiol peroxidase [Candidatus Baltobacteraceae bacterium]
MTITMGGNPVELDGPDLQVGDKAPDFTVVSDGMGDTKTLDDVIEHGRKNALLIVVPSLDTNVCSIESQKFNARLGQLPADTAAYVVSRDLPFAQKRWCGAQSGGAVRLGMLSDARDHRFGPAYGVLIKGVGLLARTVFIIGKDKTIKYKQVVPEVGSEPDYDDVIAAASKLSSAVNA